MPDRDANLGTMTLERFNGLEVYPITTAQISVRNFVTFRVKTAAAIEKTTPEELYMQPGAQLMLDSPSFDLARLVGTHLEVPEGDVDDELVASIYYGDHQPLDNNHIHFIAEEHGRVRIKWTADTCDVNYYDGSRPRTKVEVDAVFEYSARQ